MVNYLTFLKATGWEPEISFEEGARMVCEPSLKSTDFATNYKPTKLIARPIYFTGAL